MAGLVGDGVGTELAVTNADGNTISDRVPARRRSCNDGSDDSGGNNGNGNNGN